MFLMNKENSMLIFYFYVVVDDYGVKVVDLGADIVQYQQFVQACLQLPVGNNGFGEDQAGPDT